MATRTMTRGHTSYCDAGVMTNARVELQDHSQSTCALSGLRATIITEEGQQTISLTEREFEILQKITTDE